MKNKILILLLGSFFLVGCGSSDNNATFESSNNAPVIDDVILTTTNNQTINVILPKTDIDGDILSYILESQPSHGIANFTNNSFTYTPDLDFSGVDAFTYSANDAVASSEVKTITITANLNINNNVPVISSFSDSINKNSNSVNILEEFDTDGDRLVYSIVSGPSNGSVEINSNVFVYTPNPDFFGSDSFTYIASDGLADSNIANADIIINNVNNAPLIISMALPEGTEGMSYDYTVGVEDPDGDTFTVSMETVDALGNPIAAPTWLTIDSANANIHSDLIDLNSIDKVYFRITATDSFGAVNSVIKEWDIVDYSAFVSTWKTDNIGDSDNNTISFYIELNPNNIIDWGDGVVETNVNNGIKSHTYSVAGTYTISIMGIKALDLNANNGGPVDRNKIMSIENWGSSKWIDMHETFMGSANLICNALDIPDTSSVSDMSYMFNGAVSYNCDMNNWDVSSVQDMRYTFYGASSFNSPLNLWDVGNVEDLYGTFRYSAFNQDISSWDVGNVQTFVYAFANSPFNQDLSTWNVSSAIDFARMFETSPFNQDISGWNMSNAVSLSYMFYNNKQFNQDISAWNVSNVTNFGGVFYASNFDQPLNSWNVSNGTFFDSMFRSAVFNQDIGSWDVSNGGDMDYMFYGATAFDQDISSWTPINATSFVGFLSLNTSFSTANYDLLLNAWSLLPLQSGVPFGASSTNYTIAVSDAARTDIITNFTWAITDAGGI